VARKSPWVRASLSLEELESRVVPTLPLPNPVTPAPLPLPSPLVPGPGDQQILNNVLKFATTNRQVLDHLPVPYVIAVSASNPLTGSVVTTLTKGYSSIEGQAHTPIKIDADQSDSTGMGGSGFDIQVDVQAFVDQTPHLVMTVERLGNAPFAQNLSVVIAFPFAGFDLEPGLPSTPNLVIGFQTRGAGNTVGGHAPLQEVITLTPGILAGTSHSFQATMTTTGADNPLSFIIGNLDGTNLTGTLNAAGFRAYVENVPATISTTVTTTESALFSPINSSFALNWQASSASLVKLDYLENLTNPATASGPNFNTSLMTNQMPTNEQFSLALNESAGTVTLSQHANTSVSQMTFQKTRSDGLAIVGNASSVPTQMDLTMNLAGSATLTDNANVGSLAMQASKTGGFSGSSGFLGYNVGTVGIAVTAAPSLTAGFGTSGTDRTFNAAPTVGGNVIGSLEFLVSSNSPATVQLPTRWSNPAWDVLSIVDTGTADTSVPPVFAPGATAAARLLNLQSVQFIQHAAFPSMGMFFDLMTTTAAPMQGYLRTTPTSKLMPGHDIEITCEIVNVPAGDTKYTFNGPTDFSYSTNPHTGIDSMHCFGHIDTLSFDIDAGGLPPHFVYQWDPDSHLTITADDGNGNPAFVGHLAAFLADPNGISLFGDAGALFGPKLKVARMRVDNTPSVTGTWFADDASGNTTVQFNTQVPGLFAGGVQFASSTMTSDPALANPLTPAGSLSADYATFNDAGTAARNMLVGVLGIDSFSYAVTNASDIVHIVWDDNRPVLFNLNVTSGAGGVYFAQNQVSLTNSIGLVPTHLDYTADLDPMLTFNGTNAIPFIDLTFGKNQGLPSGCTLHIHADTLPAKTIFDYEPGPGTFSVRAQDTMGVDNQRIGTLLLDLQCPNGAPGTAGLLGAPIEEGRLRLDNVPSFRGTYLTTPAGTTIGLQSLAPGLSIGATQLQVSTQIDLSPSPAPMLNSPDAIVLTDPGGTAAKHLAAQMFALTNFTYFASNVGNSNSIAITQDAPRKLTATVISNSGSGQFFKGHNVQATLVANNFPTSANLLVGANGNDLLYTGSSGMDSVQIGGPALVGMPGNTYGTYDTTRIDITLNGLPSQLSYDIPGGGTFAFSAGAKVTSVDAHLRDNSTGGLDNGSVLGAALHDVRLHADGVPSFTADSTSLQTIPYFAATGASLPLLGNVVHDNVTGATAVVNEVDPAPPGLTFGEEGQIKVLFARNGSFNNGDALDLPRTLLFMGQTDLFSVGNVITGQTSGATATVRRVDQLAGSGTLYVDAVTGSFLSGEPLLVSGRTMALAANILSFVPNWGLAQVMGVSNTLGPQVDFNSSVPNVSLAGLQVGVSTRFEDPDNPAFTAATPTSTHFVNLFDRDQAMPVGNVKRVRAGLFGIENFLYTSANPAPTPYHVNVVADSARRLDVSIDTNFGPLSSSADAKGTLTVQDVPATWDLTTDLKKIINHMGSSVISHIDADVTLDDSNDGVANGARMVIHVQDVPTTFNADFGSKNIPKATVQTPRKETHAYIHASGTVTSIFVEDTKDLMSTGPDGKAEPPHWLLLEMNELPGSFDYDQVKTYDVQNGAVKKSPHTVVTTAKVTDPMGNAATLPFVRFVDSEYDSKQATLTNHLGLFTGLSGPFIQRSAYTQAIDNRYYPSSVQSRLNDLYNSSFHLTTDPSNPDPTLALEDHYLDRAYGEFPVQGVQIKLVPTGAPGAILTTTTDADGTYSFNLPGAGVYAVVETVPAGLAPYSQALPLGPVNVGSLGGTAIPSDTSNTNVISDIEVPTNSDGTLQAGTDYNFGTSGLPNPLLPAGPTHAKAGTAGTISGQVYWDENGNGIYDDTDLADYTDVQIHGLQSLMQNDDNVANTNQLNFAGPSNSKRPFFYGDDEENTRNKFTLAQLDNLPSQVTLDFKKDDHLNLTTSNSLNPMFASAGRVDVYVGSLAGQVLPGTTDAIRAIIMDAPTSIQLDYHNLKNFPGGANFQASNQFEASLIYQTADKRIVADLKMQNFTVSYGLELPFFPTDQLCLSDIVNFLPDGGLKDALKSAIEASFNPCIPTALGLFGVAAQIDATPAASGFFALYDLVDNPQPLNDPSLPTPADKEYVPSLTAFVRDFTHFKISSELELEPKPWEQIVPGTPLEIDALSTEGPNFGPNGGMTLDFWDKGVVLNWDPVKVDLPLGLGTVTIFPGVTLPIDINYANNDPWHIYPLTLLPSSPIDPFDPPAMLADHVAPAGTTATPITSVPEAIVQEAETRWQAAGVAPASLKALGSVQVVVADLPGATLGLAGQHTIWIDSDAAGYGWFVDPTPADDSEFRVPGAGPAAGRMDLLTVVTHEIGHLLGFEHNDGYAVMAERLSPGVRLVAAAGADDHTLTLDVAAPITSASPTSLQTLSVSNVNDLTRLIALPMPDQARLLPPTGPAGMTSSATQPSLAQSPTALLDRPFASALDTLTNHSAHALFDRALAGEHAADLVFADFEQRSLDEPLDNLALSLLNA
jgi:hypothetical protein